MDIDEIKNNEMSQVCEKLGFRVDPFLFNEKKTPYVIISRNDDFVTIVSDRYKLLPNEVVQIISDDIMNKTNAHHIDYGVNRSHISRNKKNQNTSDNFFIERYLVDDPVIDGDSETMAGYYVTNSIDGSISFRIRSLLYYRNSYIYIGLSVGGITRKHTKNMKVDVDGIVDLAVDSVENARKFAQTIEGWKCISVTEGEGIRLMEKIRATNIPNIYRPVYLFKPTKRVPEEDIPAPEDGLSLYEMYMHLVHTINDPPTGRLSEVQQLHYFQIIHRALVEVITPLK